MKAFQAVILTSNTCHIVLDLLLQSNRRVLLLIEVVLVQFEELVSGAIGFAEVLQYLWGENRRLVGVSAEIVKGFTKIILEKNDELRAHSQTFLMVRLEMF